MYSAKQIWFWQRIVSTHMGGLASALAARGYDVTFVAEQDMSADRAAQGWEPGALGEAQLRHVRNEAEVRETVQSAPSSSIHICQGMRGNGLVGLAQNELYTRGIAQWVIMETVDVGSGWRALAKSLVYRALIARFRGRIEGVLANGHGTPDWLVRHGMPRSAVFPFAYFLPIPDDATPNPSDGRFHILFVGQIIERKRLDLLIDAVALMDDENIVLDIVGTGPLERQSRQYAETKLGKRVTWHGRQMMSDIPGFMLAADCLVLPSNFDGWGAVVSEAIIAGTPAICSDSCGVAHIVRASGDGGVFATGQAVALRLELERAAQAGKVSADRRRRLASSGRAIGAEAGADYLERILAFKRDSGLRPIPPWADATWSG